MVRYGSLPALVGGLAWVAVRRRWRLLGWALVGLGAVLLALGALDWASWGVPWHSVVTWFRFNVGSSGAAQRFGAEPRGYYWPFLWSEVPLWVWPSLVLGVAWLRPRLGVAGAMAAHILLALVQTAHKEERFLYPVVVLLIVEAAPGLAALLERLRRGWQRAAVALVALLLTGRGAPPSTDLRGDRVPGHREGGAAGGDDGAADRERGALGLGRLLLSWESASRGSPATSRRTARSRWPCATGASTGW